MQQSEREGDYPHIAQTTGGISEICPKINVQFNFST